MAILLGEACRTYTPVTKSLRATRQKPISESMALRFDSSDSWQCRRSGARLDATGKKLNFGKIESN
jgi:hypothetical protein